MNESMINNKRPNPHPLDFDWRFTAISTEKIVTIIDDKKDVLLIGTPSIAQDFLVRDRSATLIDRQHVEGIKSQINLDINITSPIERTFNAIVIDAPWYQEELLRWISWASQCLSPNGLIYSTLWPESTRPTASKERETIFNWLNLWADFEVKDNYLSYQKPYYEQIAEKYSTNFLSEKNWFYGDLIIIKPFDILELLPKLEPENVWQRYVIGNMQLAVCEDNSEEEPTINKVRGSDGWIWPHISRRADGRDQIGFWSSDNNVAMLNGSKKFISILDAHLGLIKEIDFDLSSDKNAYFKQLFLSWSIPQNCAEKVIKWKSQD